MKRVEKLAIYESLWAIYPETFTSWIEFVKNHLVKIESLCHYQTPCLRYRNGLKISSYINRAAKYLSNKADLKPNIIPANKTIITFSNPIHLQLNNE